MKQLVEIFEEYEKLDSKTDRIEFLRAKVREFPAVRELMRYTYSPKIKMRWEACCKHRDQRFERGLGYKSIHKYHRLFEHFAEGSETPEKRALAILEGLLQDLQWEDREIVKTGLFEKKLPFKNMTTKTVQEAFPELFK